MIREIECIAPLNAKKVPIRPALVAVVAPHNLHAGIRPPHSQRGLASVAAMRAYRSDVSHLPRPRLVSVRARGERAYRANVDAHPALFALQVIFFIRSDQGTHAAVL